MSPTVDELYNRLVKPTLHEDAARDHFRLEKLHDTLDAKRHAPPEMHPTCAANGHTPVGEWTEHKAESGKVYQKCRRCNLGYLVNEQEKESRPEFEPLNPEFPLEGGRFLHMGSSPATT